MDIKNPKYKTNIKNKENNNKDNNSVNNQIFKILTLIMIKQNSYK